MQAELLRLLSRCPGCQDPFQDALVLPCLHTTCRNCLTKQANQTSGASNFVCPVCSKRHEGPVDDLPVNQVLLDLAPVGCEPLEQPLCQNECDSTASGWCTTCQVWYCDACWKLGHAIAILKSHRSVSPSQQLGMATSRCSTHDEEIKLFCSTDNKPVCSLCVVDSHTGHSISSFTAKREAVKSHFSTSTSTHLMDMRAHHQSKIDALEKELEDARKKLQAADNGLENFKSVQATIALMVDNFRFTGSGMQGNLTEELCEIMKAYIPEGSAYGPPGSLVDYLRRESLTSKVKVKVSSSGGHDPVSDVLDKDNRSGIENSFGRSEAGWLELRLPKGVSMTLNRYFMRHEGDKKAPMGHWQFFGRREGSSDWIELDQRTVSPAFGTESDNLSQWFDATQERGQFFTAFKLEVEKNFSLYHLDVEGVIRAA